MRFRFHVSLGTTFQKDLEKSGVIFCSISEAIKNHPELVKEIIWTVVPPSAFLRPREFGSLFSDGSFGVTSPPGVRCPLWN